MFARITRNDGAIRSEEIDAIVGRRDDLQAVPNRQMVNPFTQEPIAAPGAGKALYLRKGTVAGNLSLEHGELLTTGIPRAVCEELSALLHAIVRDDDRS
jgi:hypothetical protein